MHPSENQQWDSGKFDAHNCTDVAMSFQQRYSVLFRSRRQGKAASPKQLGLQWARSFSVLPNLANLLSPKLTASTLGPASCQVDSLQDPAWFHAGLSTGQSVEWEGGLNYFQATQCGLRKQLLNVKTILGINSGHETQIDTQRESWSLFVRVKKGEGCNPDFSKWHTHTPRKKKGGRGGGQKSFLENKAWRAPAFPTVTHNWTQKVSGWQSSYRLIVQCTKEEM